MLFLLTPDLGVLGRYQKMHLVPFGEYVPAAVRTLLPFVQQIVPTLAPAAPGDDFAVLEFRPAVGSRAGGQADEPGPERAGGPGGPASRAPQQDVSEIPARAVATPEQGAAAAPDPGPVRLAPLICFDAIFPEIVQDLHARGPGPGPARERHE